MIKLHIPEILRIPSPGYHAMPLVELIDKENPTILEKYSLCEEIEYADFGIVPVCLVHLFQVGKKNAVKEYIETLARNDKEVIVFSGGDFGMTLPYENLISIRLGGFHSKLGDHTYIMPPFVNDPVKKWGQDFSLLEYTDRPSLGFVGKASGGSWPWIKEFLNFVKSNFKRRFSNDPTDRQGFYPSSVRRYQYLTQLSNDDRVDTQFILRNKYRAGRERKVDVTQTEKEFYQNMKNNPFIFCLRGTGNFSARFYEALALGRIPLVIDTDFRLPFHDTLPWDQHIVLVKPEDEKDWIGTFTAIYKQLSPDEFKEIQTSNRKLWLNFLTKESFFVQLHDCLIKPV